jgi:catechol 2,3-dioxygenase-like lactoylglutathione lyase family enzyme
MQDQTRSVVDLGATARLHLALAVSDIERSKAFYRALFDIEPNKVRPNYARFEVRAPSVNLALNQVDEAAVPAGAHHYGVQVDTLARVSEVTGRLAAAGFDLLEQGPVACCYAVANKIWATDPDGHRWEVYVLLDDESDHYSSTAIDVDATEPAAAPAQSCCAPGCCP